MIFYNIFILCCDFNLMQNDHCLQGVYVCVYKSVNTSVFVSNLSTSLWLYQVSLFAFSLSYDYMLDSWPCIKFNNVFLFYVNVHINNGKFKGFFI